MKRFNYILYALMLFTAMGCRKDFLEKNPQAELIEEQLLSEDAVEGTLTGAYALLNGNLNGTWDNYASGPSQWLLGEVTSDNAHKGSTNGDQPNMNALEQHEPTSTNNNLSVMWTRCYEGIQRCNNTIRLLNQLQASTNKKFSEERAIEIQGEARVLRAHYYFFLARAFKNVPLITEATTDNAVDNAPDIYPAIIADLQFGVDNLQPVNSKEQVARVNKIAAQAYLGKVLLYQKNYEEALGHLNEVITARGNIENMPYTDNFDITKENGPESIFAVQHAVGTDGSGGENGNVGDMLNFPYGSGIPINCCGFFQPTIDLANSFKVTATGLPYLDNGYRDDPYKSDLGLSTAQKATYQVDRTLTIDPRMDYTLGRRGVPYRDWGLMAGDSWIRESSNGGPFVSYKNSIESAQIGSGTAPGTTNVTGLNVMLIRLADVYLMAAECEVEAGNLSRALTLVNQIRRRAAKLPAKTVGGAPIAVYRVEEYPSFTDQNYARNAVRFERRLELALEGHRFYDLVRWGILKPTLESYYAFESTFFPYLRGITIQPNDEYFPIPQEQIDRSNGVLKQNEGY
jgi:hypothetical protein